MLRPKWHEYFMMMAKMVASRSTCNSRPNGCVLVQDNQILSTGYNGSVPGQEHCIDFGHDYCVRRISGVKNVQKQEFCVASHAEINALAMAAKHGISVNGAIAYMTLNPCMVCLKALRVAGIIEVWYELEYDLNPDAMYDTTAMMMGFNRVGKSEIHPQMIEYLKTFLDYPTARRRKPATD